MKELVAQVIARLAEGGIVAHDTVVDDTPAYPYVLLWVGTGGRRSVDLASPRAYLADRLGVTSAGLTAESVRKTAARAFALLDGWTPTPADGWRYDEVRLREGESEPITADADTPPIGIQRVLTAVDFYDVSATPL